MTLSDTSRSRLIIAASFGVALVLAVMPGPIWAEQFRPDWTALVLIYWCIAVPQRVSVGTGWTVGLALDVLNGSLLGQHALALGTIAYLAGRLHTQLRVFPRWQQAASVLLLLLVNYLAVLWVRALIDQAPASWSYWTPSIVGALVWPWLFVILRDVRRRWKVG
jgi:rod shape-determining protein MreD